MWLPLNSTNECVIIINHQTFKFLIPQHTVTRIFISSEDALSLLLLFASPSFLSPSPVCCCVVTSPIAPLSQSRWCGSLFDTVLHHTCGGRLGTPPSFPLLSCILSLSLEAARLGQHLVLYKSQAGSTSLRAAGTEQDALREGSEVSLPLSHPCKLIIALNTYDPYWQTLPSALSHSSQTTKKLPCSSS